MARLSRCGDRGVWFLQASVAAVRPDELYVNRMCSTEMSLLISTANPPCLHTVGWDAFSETGQDNRLFGGAELQRLAHLSELVWVKSPTSKIYKYPDADDHR